MAAGARDDSDVVFRILVVDGQPFQRRLIGETLRVLGRVDIAYAENAEQCQVAFSYFQPDLMIADWALPGVDGLGLVKRLRAGDGGETARRLPVIMVSDRARQSDLDRARDAGIDEFVLRPFSTATLLDHIEEVRVRRREFIDSPAYVGPCRRRRADAAYDGPKRRLFDMADNQADAPDVQIRKGLARMYVERIAGLLAAAAPGDREAMRHLCLACGQLSALAADLNERLLVSATSSLFTYVKAVGADAALNREVVQAHLDAIVQLADLPNSQADIRQTVTQQLNVMVAKKLRQAGQAA